LLALPVIGGGVARGAEDPLRFALIGAGGRGRYLHQTFQNLGARCEAVCDVYEPNLMAAKEASPAEARTYFDYRRMLEREKLDFVVVGTPDHHHCPNLLAALDAGLDVYTEKPLSLSLEESARMVKAVKNSDRIVQVGMQRRSMGHIYKLKEHIADGVIGEVSLAKAKWNWNFTVPLDNSPLPGKLEWDLFLGDAPKRDLEPKRFRWWRGFYDYSGGNMTDQGTHLMDVVQWMTGNEAPVSAVAQGYIAAAKAGADVTGMDVDPAAIEMAVKTARANRVTCRWIAGDALRITDDDLSCYDVIIAGDVFYEERFAEGITGVLRNARRAGLRNIAADVGRTFRPRTGVRVLCSMRIPVYREIEGIDYRDTNIITLAAE
jgi:predicted dehydrogenase